jgi:hypothetical protein
MPMSAKVKSPVFIDSLQFVVSGISNFPSYIKAVLKDDTGNVCSIFESNVSREENVVIWRNLNDLPYGVYTLDLFHEKAESRIQLVKRI